MQSPELLQNAASVGARECGKRRIRVRLEILNRMVH